MADKLIAGALPDVPFYRALASGHMNRKGHALVAFLAVLPDGTVQVIRECCADGKS